MSFQMSHLTAGAYSKPLLAVRHGLSGCPARRGDRLTTAPAFGRYGDLPTTTAGTAAGDSNRLEDYLKSPFDLAAFGPRLALGVLLSAQETAQKLQTDLENANILLQDPRTPQEKQQVVAQELSIRITNYLQRGAAVEAELFTAVTAMLPAEVQQQLPPQFKDILLRGTTTNNKRIPISPPVPLEQSESAPISPAATAQSQTAAELQNLRGSVSTLRKALSDLSSNKDPAQEGVLKVNALDARTSLARKLAQLNPVAPNVMGASVQAAVDESSLLLREADALRL